MISANGLQLGQNTGYKVGIPVEKKKAIEQIKRHQSIVNNALNTVAGGSASINGGGSIISN